MILYMYIAPGQGHTTPWAIIFLFSDLQTRRLYYLRKANKNKTPTLLFYYFLPRRFHGFSRQRNKSIQLYTVKKCVRLYCVTGNENQSLTDDKKLKVEPVSQFILPPGQLAPRGASQPRLACPPGGKLSRDILPPALVILTPGGQAVQAGLSCPPPPYKENFVVWC